MSSDDQLPETVIGGFDTHARTWVIGALTLGGGLLGVVLPWLGQQAARLPWLPFQGPLELLTSFDGTWLLWGRPLIGAVLGLAFAIWIVAQTAVVTVRAEQLEIRRHGDVQRVIPRETVGGVHRQGSKTVIEAREGRVLFHDDIEGDKAAIRKAFVDHGYPWEGGLS